MVILTAGLAAGTAVGDKIGNGTASREHAPDPKPINQARATIKTAFAAT